MLPYMLIGGAAVSLIGLFIAMFARPQPPPEAQDGRQPPGKKSADADERDAAKAKLRERLVHAGLYKQNSPTFFYALQLSFLSIPVVLCMVGYRMGLYNIRIALFAGVFFGILGVVGPGLWLDYLKSARQTSIRRSIPDALDVITICVEAGLSLNSAIVRVSKELSQTYPLLATELLIVHRQIQLGKTAGEAIRSFAERFDLSELRSLSSVISQSDKFGASIAKALRTHGETLRKKRMQQAHAKAQKAATYILLPTVLCIFPAIFVVIMGPAAFDIMEMLGNR